MIALAGAVAGAEPVNEQGDLAAAVARWRQLAEEVVSRPGEHRAALAELRASVSAPVLSLERRRLDVGWLHEAVHGGRSGDLGRAWERLKAWEEALAAGPPPADARSAAAAVLAGDEYQPVRAASWIDPWLPHLERLFDLLFGPLIRRTGPGGEVGATVLYGLLIGLLGALTARAVRRRERSVSPPARPVARPAGRTAGDWRDQAAAAAADGHHSAAAACYTTALLLRLDETGRLPYAPARTLREAAAAVEPGLAAALAALAADLEAVWYGGTPAAAELSGRCAELCGAYWEPAPR